MDHRKYESYDDLVNGLDDDAIPEEDDVGALDDEDLNILIPFRREPDDQQPE